MAISPPGDIVLDVMKAADPSAAATARARLASLGNATTSASFASEVSARTDTAPASSSTAPSPEAFAKFEAMVLQSFFQSMMPEDTSSVYGQGLSGEMWQNLLAEQLGHAVAKRGGIGIADRILRDYYVAGEKKVSMQGVANDPEQSTRDTEKMLSVALIDELQRMAARSLSSNEPDSATGNDS